MKVRDPRAWAAPLVLSSAFVFGVAVYSSLQWIGRTVPGFLVMDNLVVASVSLPAWEESLSFFQHEILEVDGNPVHTSDEVYSYAGDRRAGTSIAYTLRTPTGETIENVAIVRNFTRADYAILFGAFLINGVAFLSIGIAIFLLKPNTPAAIGLLSTCTMVGIFVTTAVDLYGPHLFFRLHAFTEAVAAAGFIHLAAVFPTDRIRKRRTLALAAIYTPFILLGLAYNFWLYDAPTYTFLHLVASGGFGICTISIVASIVYDWVTSKSPLIRRRIAIVALGSISGILPTAALFAFSAAVGGTVPINAVAMSAFLFPLSIGYAIIKRDLFEIDAMLRRALAYGIVIVSLTALYFVVLYVFGLLLPGQATFAHSPATLAIINLGLVFLIAPIRGYAQSAVDRVFFRQAFDPEVALGELSLRLACARRIEMVESELASILETTICPDTFALFILGPDGSFRGCSSKQSISLPAALEHCVRGGHYLARYEFADQRGPLAEIWNDLGADLLIPIRTGSDFAGFISLGPKMSGRPYTVHDMTFLQTAANQLSLAISNADAFNQLAQLNQHLEELNQGLENLVEERTAALHASNKKLNHSFNRLKTAYGALEKNQAGLLRADRLATLGRLAAGVAHEINTPLAAVLNALKVITDLGAEYRDAIDDTEVLPDDHRQIAAELLDNTRAAIQFGRKAAEYVKRVKQHGYEGRPNTTEHFLVETVVRDAEELVRYRLGSATCQVVVSCSSPEIKAYGDSARLGQVVVNLFTNAIDAYEDSGVSDGVIAVEIDGIDGKVVLRVSDSAGGISDEVFPHIFDELFTTKDAGRGTGLGLWIARNLVGEAFCGTLNAVRENGGTCFTAEFPDEPAALPRPAFAVAESDVRLPDRRPREDNA